MITRACARNVLVLDITQFSLTLYLMLSKGHDPRCRSYPYVLFVYLNLYILFVIYFLLLSLRHFALLFIMIFGCAIISVNFLESGVGRERMVAGLVTIFIIIPIIGFRCCG